MTRTKKQTQTGSILVTILLVSVFLSIIIVSLVALAGQSLTRSRGRLLLLQAQYAAESGADAAIAILNGGNTSYTGTASDVSLLTGNTYSASYSVSVANGSTGKEKIITATGKVYSPKTSPTPNTTRTIEVIAQRTSSSSTTSIASRNVMEIESGVKNIFAKDVYINGYIHTNKNTTNLVFENVTVADKITSASNCSVSGTGNWVKPSSFTTPGQTKTNITLAYNNCISPPGNTSNASFNVLANQNNISKIQSTQVPWSQYMDSSYQNSPTYCNDWTTGASPRDIPRTGNAKKTHYPDSSSNTVSTCGTSGDIALGNNQYNLNDHAHVRANFCASVACTPIFNNPDSSLKFLFVEGTVNFDSIRTAAGSGPIAIIVYGADPASKTSVCPLGGAAYLAQGSPSSYTNAPKLYILSTNGICLDKTKFGAAPALGGISGKNIYVATNSGTPFDLKLDPTFPTDQIPIDLSWRAVRYRRL